MSPFECNKATPSPATPFVAEKILTIVSFSHGTPRYRSPPQRSTTFSPRRYTQTAAPRSNLVKKFSLKKNFKIKTICVGNIFIGGTGKTSLAIEINELLKKKFKTVFIKKNYDNQLDEINLLNNKGKIIVSNNRESALLSAIKKKYELAILDDGLQQKNINYDLKTKYLTKLLDNCENKESYEDYLLSIIEDNLEDLVKENKIENLKLILHRYGDKWLDGGTTCRHWDAGQDNQ